MNETSARLFSAGHFFTGCSLLLLFCSCSSSTPATEDPGKLIPLNRDIPMMICLAGPADPDSGLMPEAAAELEHTASGRFQITGPETIDPFSLSAEMADSAGLLLLLVLPPGMEWQGTRDHLIIRLDDTGRPDSVTPPMDSWMLADSLWQDPVTRQNTIADLVDFTRPDLVIQFLPESQKACSVAGFWSEYGSIRGLVTCIFSLPDPDRLYRGWGLFTGSGVSRGNIPGMTAGDFSATFLMLAGLPWEHLGYPVIGAFNPTENE